MHKAFHDKLPQMLSDNIVMKRPTGYSLRASDSLTVPRFSSMAKTLLLIEAQYYGIF